MKWFNLKSNKCPQCNKDFMKGLETKKVGQLTYLGGNISAINVLMIHPCGFKITDQRYREIVSEMTTKQLKETTYE